MKGTTLTVDDLLDHMSEACRKITEYTAGMDEEAFYQSPKTLDAVVKNIEVLGEAANALIKNYPIFTESASEIPWRQLNGMRNRLVHGYFDIDRQVVWKTVVTDIPLLANSLVDIQQNQSQLIAAASRNNGQSR